MLEYGILGPLEVVGEHGPVRLGGPRQRATLGLLLLSANRVVPVEWLADELYAGRPPVTAVTQVQRQVSELRRVLGSASAIETRVPGYVLHVGADALDLARFERLTAEAQQARSRGDPGSAAELLGEALGLWRGPPLADLEYEPFARAALARLEELRLAALEERIENDLTLGRHASLVGELEALVAAHPLRERLRGQRMLALYRSGRQAEALAAYTQTRETLVDRFGIEPSPALQTLQRSMLEHDAALDVPSSADVATPVRAGSVVVATAHDDRLDALLAIAGPLAVQASRELIVVRLLADERGLAEAAAALSVRRGPLVRTAAFTSEDVAADVVRLATGNDADLVLIDAPPELTGPNLPDQLAAVLEGSPADVAVLSGPAADPAGEVFVPFGGGEHDWAALEVGAWLALSTGAPMRLVGTRADPRSGRRDASRLLADASLAVQRVVGIDAVPLLADPGERALVEAVAEAGVVVVGLSSRWRHEGIGPARSALVGGVRSPVLLVHRGPRPSVLAPHPSRSRFTWTLEP